MEEKLRAHLKSEVVNATPCQCKFPFKYGEPDIVSHDHCTRDEIQKGKTVKDAIDPWCATAVDSIVSCATGCPTDSKYKEWAAAQSAKK